MPFGARGSFTLNRSLGMAGGAGIAWPVSPGVFGTLTALQLLGLWQHKFLTHSLDLHYPPQVAGKRKSSLLKKLLLDGRASLCRRV